MHRPALALVAALCLAAPAVAAPQASPSPAPAHPMHHMRMHHMPMHHGMQGMGMDADHCPMDMGKMHGMNCPRPMSAKDTAITMHGSLGDLLLEIARRDHRSIVVDSSVFPIKSLANIETNLPFDAAVAALADVYQLKVTKKATIDFISRPQGAQP